MFDLTYRDWLDIASWSSGLGLILSIGYDCLKGWLI